MQQPRQPAVFLAPPLHAHGAAAGTSGGSGHLVGQHRPAAVLVFSPAWHSRVTTVTCRDRPYNVIGGDAPAGFRYLVSGSTSIADDAVELLHYAGIEAQSDAGRGLDLAVAHVLARLLPRANVPVIQASFDPALPPAGQFSIGAAVRALRNHGVMVVVMAAPHRPAAADRAFDDWLLGRLRAGDRAALFAHARAPLPLFIALGAAFRDETVHMVPRSRGTAQASLVFGTADQTALLADILRPGGAQHDRPARRPDGAGSPMPSAPVHRRAPAPGFSNRPS